MEGTKQVGAKVRATYKDGRKVHEEVQSRAHMVHVALICLLHNHLPTQDCLDLAAHPIKQSTVTIRYLSIDCKQHPKEAEAAGYEEHCR